MGAVPCRTLFVIGVVLSGSVCYGGLMESFDPRNWWAVLLGQVVIAIGAAIGGIFTNLLRQEALGLSMGFFAIVLLLLIEGGTAFSHTLPSLVLNTIVFLSTSLAGWAASRKNEDVVTLLSTSLTGSFVVLCACDVFGLLQAKTSILSDLSALLRYEWGAIGQCPSGGCHGFIAVSLWLLVAVGGFFFQVRPRDITPVKPAVRGGRTERYGLSRSPRLGTVMTTHPDPDHVYG